MRSPSHAGQQKTISSPNCFLSRCGVATPLPLRPPPPSPSPPPPPPPPTPSLSFSVTASILEGLGSGFDLGGCSILALSAVSDTCRRCRTEAGNIVSTLLRLGTLGGLPRPSPDPNPGEREGVVSSAGLRKNPLVEAGEKGAASSASSRSLCAVA